MPTIYQKAAEAAIASYSYADLASGTGFVKYHGGDDQSGHILNASVFYSESTKTMSAASNATAATIQLTLNFDIEFNKPQLIKGRTLLNIGAGMKTNGAAAETMNS